jgi:hypothetical protein
LYHEYIELEWLMNSSKIDRVRKNSRLVFHGNNFWPDFLVFDSLISVLLAGPAMAMCNLCYRTGPHNLWGLNFFFKPIILKIDQILFEGRTWQEIEAGAVERVLVLWSRGRGFESHWWWYFLVIIYIYPFILNIWIICIHSY